MINKLFTFIDEIKMAREFRKTILFNAMLKSIEPEQVKIITHYDLMKQREELSYPRPKFGVSKFYEDYLKEQEEGLYDE